MSRYRPFELPDFVFNYTITADIEPADNITLSFTCAVRSFENPVVVTHPYSTALNTAVRSFQALFYIVIFLLGNFLNLLVIVLVAKYKKLRTRSTLFAFQIIVLNFVFTSTVFLIRPVTAIADKWLFGESMCIMSGFLVACFSSVRLFLMAVFTVDRFLAVFFSFSYPKRSSKVILWASITTWVATITFRAITLPWGLDCYAHIETFHLCAFTVVCSRACLAYGYSTVVLLHIPATVFPIVIYTLLYCKARRIKNTVNSESSAMKVHKQEWKPTVTFFLLFVSVIALKIPHFLATVAIYSAFEVPPVGLHVFVAVLQVVAAFPVVVDPIVILRDENFKGTLLEICTDMCQKSNSAGHQREEEKTEEEDTEM